MANIIFRGATAPTAANAAGNKGLPLTNDEIDKNLFALNVGPTIGTTTISPGTTSLTLAGLTSVTATNFYGTASNVTTNANLTGDVTSAGNVTTLANTTVTAGSYGSATAIPVITVDSKGRLTAASTSAITVGDGALTVSSSAGATATSVVLSLSGAYSANTSTARSLNFTVGPALTALATLMTTATAGFIRRTGQDTYAVDTNTYLTSYTESDTLASVTGRGFITRASSTAFATSGQGNPALEVYGAGGVEPSYLTFHRPGVYAIKLGLDGSDLKVGGWSMGAVAYKVWHEGNLTNLNQLTNSPGYTTTRLSARNTDDIFVSGDISFIGAGVATVTRSGNAFTVTSTDTDTNTTYSIASAAGTGGANLGLTASGSGSGTDNVLFQSDGGTTVSSIDVNTIRISSTAVGDGALTVSSSAGATATSVVLSLSGAYSANTSTARSLNFTVGPALSALATLMTTATAGFIRRTGQDTYAVDTNTYLTSYTESDTLATVTGRGATTSTASTFNGGITVKDSMSASTTNAGGTFNLFSNLTGSQGLLIAGGNLTTGTDKYVYIGTGGVALNGNHATSTTEVHIGGNTSGSLTKVWSPLTVVGTIGGSNLSGTNTGDETTATIKTKLSITTLSGSNTGDQTLPTTLPHNGSALSATTGTFSGAISASNLSGTNTGDETTATIKTKLSITTLSGSNTGDQTLPTTLPHNGSALSATTGTFSGAISASNLSGTNTGDQTLPTTLPHNGSALSATTGTFSGAISASNLSGTNTGDQTLPTTLPHNGSALSATTGTFSGAISASNLSGTNTGDNKINANSVGTGVVLNLVGVTTADASSTASVINSGSRLATINPNTSELKLTGSYGLISLLPSSTSTPAYIYSGSTTGFMLVGSTTNIASISSTGIISAGDITGYGTPSDIRLKENIVKLDNCLSKVEQLNGYSFNYIGKSNRMIGVIAQELEKVAPELVYETESLETGETSKAVRYSQITAILIEAIKELNAKVTDLQNQLNNK